VYHSRELRAAAVLAATASPIPRAAAAAAASTEFGGGRKRAAPKGRALDGGGNPNQVYGQPYRGFEPSRVAPQMHEASPQFEGRA